MFSTEVWLGALPQGDLSKALYDHILNPMLFEMGEAEAQARTLARENWVKPETYLFYQPSTRKILW